MECFMEYRPAVVLERSRDDRGDWPVLEVLDVDLGLEDADVPDLERLALVRLD